MVFKVFFYKGKGFVNRLISIAIKIKTGKLPRYTHSGLVIDNKIMIDTDPKKKYNMRDWTGISSDFDYIDIETDLPTYQRLLEYIYTHRGVEYDIWECIRWFFDIGKDDKSKLNCVEAVTDALNYAGVTYIDDEAPLSVDDLYDKIMAHQRKVKA